MDYKCNAILPNIHMFWCHLCELDLSDYESFRIHIMEKHRPSSLCYEGSEDSEIPNLKQCFQAAYDENDIGYSHENKDQLLDEQSRDKANMKTDKGTEDISNEGDKMSHRDTINNMNSTKIEYETLIPSTVQGKEFSCSKNCMEVSNNTCNMCSIPFSEESEVDHHMSSKHKPSQEQISDINISKLKLQKDQTSLNHLNYHTNVCSNNIGSEFNISRYQNIAYNHLLGNTALVQNQSAEMPLNSVYQVNNSEMANGYYVIATQPNSLSDMAISCVSIPPASSLDYSSEDFTEAVTKIEKYDESLKYPLPSRLLGKVEMLLDMISDDLSIQGSQTKDNKKLDKLLKNVIAKHNNALKKLVKQ